MHTEEKRVQISLLLRLGGTLTGAILSALGATILFFIAAVLDVLSGGISYQSLVIGMGFAGGCIGFALPRETLNSLWFFFPELFEHP